MDVIIFTDESGVKLPEIKRNGNTGKASNIETDLQIISLLKGHNLSVPKNDIEMEDQYLDILNEFIRPARYMFAGPFTEVRDFTEKLSESISTKLYIISGRYGLLKDDDRIIPYISNIQNIHDLQKLDERTKFSKKMAELAEKHDFLIISLPRFYLSYLLNIGWFDKIKLNIPISIVSGKEFYTSFSQYPNIIHLSRKGVARLGEENRERILKIIQSKVAIIEPNEV